MTLRTLRTPMPVTPPPAARRLTTRNGACVGTADRCHSPIHSKLNYPQWIWSRSEWGSRRNQQRSRGPGTFFGSAMPSGLATLLDPAMSSSPARVVGPSYAAVPASFVSPVAALGPARLSGPAVPWGPAMSSGPVLRLSSRASSRAQFSGSVRFSPGGATRRPTPEGERVVPGGRRPCVEAATRPRGGSLGACRGRRC